jgi:hypothetical protein
MTEDQSRMVDALCKIVATIGLLLGGAWTLYTYFNARAAEAKTAIIEAKKPFLDRRLQTYLDVIQTVSIMATKDKETDERRTATAKFWALYHGPTVLVQTKEVQAAMDAIAQCVRSQKCDREAELWLLMPPLIRACRDSIARSWDVDLSTNNNLIEDN